MTVAMHGKDALERENEAFHYTQGFDSAYQVYLAVSCPLVGHTYTVASLESVAVRVKGVRARDEFQGKVGIHEGIQNGT